MIDRFLSALVGLSLTTPALAQETGTLIQNRRAAQVDSQPLSAPARTALTMEQFGECVARAEPGETRKLLLSLPGSETEREQFAVLNSRIAACVVSGSTITMSKAVARGAIAEGTYRLSQAVGGAAK